MRTVDEYSDNYYRLRMTKSPTPPQSTAQATLKVPSQSLLGARKELVITHNGREYRLRVTQNGKLILTA
jgi:hemin uptake protein HemP